MDKYEAFDQKADELKAVAEDYDEEEARLLNAAHDYNKLAFEAWGEYYDHLETREIV